MKPTETLSRLLSSEPQLEEKLGLLRSHLIQGVEPLEPANLPDGWLIPWRLGVLCAHLKTAQELEQLQELVDSVDAFGHRRRRERQEQLEEAKSALRFLKRGDEITVWDGQQERAAIFEELKRTRFHCRLADESYSLPVTFYRRAAGQ